MKLERIAPDDHRLEESYHITFDFADIGSEHDFQGRHVKYTARPSTVILAWKRGLINDWRRSTNSRIIGHRVLKSGNTGEQQTTVDIFTYRGDITPCAASIPELVDLITETENRLPARRYPITDTMVNDTDWVLKSLHGSQNFTDAALRLAKATATTVAESGPQ